MKKILLVILLGVVLTMYGEEVPYSRDPERKAIKFAYEILKLYYPSDQLCVSDSIYDQNWFPVIAEADYWLKEDIFENKYLKNVQKLYPDSPVYSESLSSVFRPDTCRCNKYVAEFSAPYKGMILCEILPGDRKIGILGEPMESLFVFKYNEDGDIEFVSRHIHHND